jgi:hypothetical protein
MSHQSAYLHAPAEAVDLARAAGRAATDAGVDAIRAEAAVLEAHGHAVAGEEKACAVALDRAERTLDRANRDKDPQWIGYFDAVGTDAVVATEGLNSARAVDYLARLAERLAPHAGLPAVQDFIEQARPVLAATGGRSPSPVAPPAEP